MRMKDINEDYTNAKRIILDYNYQLGKISALYFVISKYKEDKDKITEDIKLRVKTLRDQMERIDAKIISMLMDKVQ